MSEASKKELEEKRFRIRSTLKTLQLELPLNHAERELVLETMNNYLSLLDALLTKGEHNKLVEIPPEVADSGKAIDEYLKQQKEKPDE